MKKIRVGIIGTGFGARVHAPMMKSHPGFEVVAIASVSRGRIDTIKQETGIANVYDNWEEMLENEELDLVSVASAPLLHHDMAVKAFEKGFHVLCEKPMAFDTEQAKRMIDARDKANRLGFINFEFRFVPARQKIKEVVASGQLGEIMHVNYSTSLPGYEKSTTNKRGWLGQKEQAGGMLGAIGSHMFDSLLWWTDAEVESITGQLATHVPEFVDEAGEKEIRTADDAFQAAGTFVGGGTFSVGLVSAARHTTGWKLEITGTDGTLIMTEDNKVLVGVGNEPLAEVELLADLEVDKDMDAVAARYYNAFYRSIEQVYAAIEKNQVHPTLASFEAGHKVQVILDAMSKSHEERRTIDL